MSNTTTDYVSSTCVWVTASFVGFHCWPDAPKSVEYLSTLHRHKFNVKAQTAASHQNRAVEFHMFKDDLLDAIKKAEKELIADTAMSCEMLAQSIGSHLLERKYALTHVSVDEDGECGATVNFLHL